MFFFDFTFVLQFFTVYFNDLVAKHIGLYSGLCPILFLDQFKNNEFAFNSLKKSESIAGRGIEPTNTNVRIEDDGTYCPPARMGNVTMGTPVPIREVKGETIMGDYTIKTSKKNTR